MNAFRSLHLSHVDFVHLHPLGFTVYRAITSQGIPRPNKNIHNQYLPCILPLPVKGFLDLMILPKTTPLSFETIWKSNSTKQEKPCHTMTIQKWQMQG